MRTVRKQPEARSDANYLHLLAAERGENERNLLLFVVYEPVMIYTAALIVHDGAINRKYE